MKSVRKILMFLLVLCLSIVMGMHGLQAADIDLAEDSDWRGTNVVVAGRVRLNGHRLRLDNLAGIESITDSQEEYQILEYIKSTGTQYIDTGYVHTKSTRLEFDLLVGPSLCNDYLSLFGTMPNDEEESGGTWFFSPLYGSAYYGLSYIHCALARGGGVGMGPSFPCEQRTEIVFFGNNVTWTPSWTTPTFVNELGTVASGRSTLFVFNVNTGSSAAEKRISDGCFDNATLFSFRIYEGNRNLVPVRDYVPARRVADGAVGLWERRLNTFHPNCGTGTFVAGPVVAAESCPYGELHIDVPAGVTLTNETARIEGTVKVVKEGDGTFCSSTESPFMGGLRIEAGMVKSLTHGDEVRAHGMLDGDIFVSTNGVFDVNGTSMVGYNFKLARGTVRNSGPPGDMMMPHLIHVSLLDDAQFDFQHDYGIMSGRVVFPTTLDLAGHTLTVSVAEGSNFFISATTVTGDGALRVVGPGTFWPCLAHVIIEEAKLVTECRISMEMEVYVRDYEADVIGVDLAPQGDFYVFGVFKPKGDFTSVALCDGATIDLTEHTDPLQWTASSDLLIHGNSTVYIDVGEPRGRQWAIDWSDGGFSSSYLAQFASLKPVPDARYRLLVVPDKGIRIVQSGFVITFR